ncbi:MAG: hypothetical protein HYY46_15130 [Deltaproteobacteria bacterium]|nr:hypothetical protein [Deltaproteobacteria bacterium]
MAITRDQIVERIRDLARAKGETCLTRKDFFDASGVSQRLLHKHFPRWNDAVIAAGLIPLGHRGRPGRKKGFSPDVLIEKLKGVAKQLNRDYVSQVEFTKQTRISYRPINRLFGDWDKFVVAAGLRPHPSQHKRIPETELFDDYLRVYQTLGRHPSYHEFANAARFSINTYAGRRFGGLKRFRRLATAHGIQQGILSAEIEAEDNFTDKSVPDKSRNVYTPLNDRPVLGEALDFRGLQHAPINEMGVVYLFGMLSEELGFVVESVQAGYPDCEAKRRLPSNRWQRVRIEFEFLSSNFLRHKHDLAGCDLIVCWKHDWKNCPLEVLVLSDFVTRPKSK